jgi:hypothetical protein
MFKRFAGGPCAVEGDLIKTQIILMSAGPAAVAMSDIAGSSLAL